MADRDARTVPPAQVPRPALPDLPRAAPVREETLPGSPAPPPRSYSPPPWASDAETGAVEAMAESRGERIQRPAQARPARPRQDTPPWVEQPWWRTTGGMVRVLGAFFTGLATLGVGGWMATKAEEPPKPPPPIADVACPKFEEEDAPRGALCMRIYHLEKALGAVQAAEAARREREAREREMLGELPKVKTTPKANP